MNLVSKNLKSINDEAVDKGESVKETIDKLAKALDKGREVGIQEAVYRLLGVKMTKFSAVVRFVNTNHPDRRDGMLKSDLPSLSEDEAIFQNSLHDYYQDRPYSNEQDPEEWNEMSLSDFIACYIAYKSSGNSERKKKNQATIQQRVYYQKRTSMCHKIFLKV